MVKKPSHEELENKNTTLLAIAIVLGVFFVMSLALPRALRNEIENLKQENTALREGILEDIGCPIIINGTPVNCHIEYGKGLTISNIEQPQIDYHSSGELFCEHYNSTYEDLGFYKACVSYKDDLRIICYVSYKAEKKKDNLFYFIEECPIASEVSQNE